MGKSTNENNMMTFEIKNTNFIYKKPNNITLIELVRDARKHCFKWIAIDPNNKPYFYDSKPFVGELTNQWKYNGHECMRSQWLFKLTCDWKKAIIEVSKIKEKG